MQSIVRAGTNSDIKEIFELVKELAVFERALDQVSNTVAKMERDFEAKLFDFVVAEVDGRIVGLSLYYFRYSTWKGKRLFMEDIIVTESMRGQGIGKVLFDETLKIAKETSCTGMMWQVLNWNTSAIGFYRKYGTSFDDEWINSTINF